MNYKSSARQIDQSYADSRHDARNCDVLSKQEPLALNRAQRTPQCYYYHGALVAVRYSAGFAIGRLRVRISAWATLHQGLLSLPSLRGR